MYLLGCDTAPSLPPCDIPRQLRCVHGPAEAGKEVAQFSRVAHMAPAILLGCMRRASPTICTHTPSPLKFRFVIEEARIVVLDFE